jgi:hypothetical protein
MKIAYFLEPTAILESMWRHIETNANLSVGTLEGVDANVILVDGTSVSLSDFIKEITFEVVI